MTTVSTVATSTTASVRGSLCSVVTDFQSNVLIDTIIITPASAAIGICTTMLPSTMIKNIKNIPATSADKRPRPPDLTLMS